MTFLGRTGLRVLFEIGDGSPFPAWNDEERAVFRGGSTERVDRLQVIGKCDGAESEKDGKSAKQIHGWVDGAEKIV